MVAFSDTITVASIPIKILEAYQGRTILITGGRGYIGSALTQSLAEIDCKLILFDQSPGAAWRPESPRAEVVLLNGDVSEAQFWNAVLPGVDYVFHLAAKEYFYRSDYNPERDLQFNALPILRLLEACRGQSFRPQIVFASSANLFGLVDTLPVNEDHRDNPLTMWAVHKLTAENYLRLYAQQFDIQSITLRLANVYGPTARWSAMDRVVINKVVAKALNGETLMTYANHGCVRDYVFLKDVVGAFLLAGACCGSTKNLVYVIGSGEGKSIADVWQLIADCVKSNVGKNVPIRSDASVKIEPLEWRDFVADTQRFHNATGWKPQTELTQGIDICVRAFLSKSGRSS
ncbi:MAG: GDP-mannose 4,6-dehydratase [Deltaproteobacteria bacterium]|nr:GDP-mannose 4,6-dehydratase [Deltaproteobacteria bacterium]